MSSFLPRDLTDTSKRYIGRASPDVAIYPPSDWVKNADFSNVGGPPPASTVPIKYWVTPVVGSAVQVMDQAGKDVVDAAQDVSNVLAAESRLEARIGLPSNPLSGEVWSIVVSGLEITVTHDPLIVGFVHAVVADVSDTTSIQVFMMYEAVPDEGDDKFFIRAFEKTTGEYADIPAGEVVVDNLGNYTLPANGTDLVEA